MLKKHKLMRRRVFLLSLGTLATIAAIAKSDKFREFKNSLQLLDNKERDFTVVGDGTLRDRAAAKKLIYGAASDYRYLSVDAELAADFAKECSILTPENDMKWRIIRPTPDSFNFAQSDWLASFAAKQKMLLREIGRAV